MMTVIKIIFLTIIKKTSLILLGGGVGAGAGYFFNSELVGITTFVVSILFIYIRFLGPMHFVTKSKIKFLVENDILINMLVSPYSSDILKQEDNDWFVGEGGFDRFIDIYKTKCTKKGIEFYCVDMPYLPIYILPWLKVKEVSKNTELIKEMEFSEPSYIFDLTLINNEHIFLPLSEVSIERWIKSKRGQE